MAERRDFEPAAQCEFLEDVVDVALDRVDGDVQPCGDLLVAEPLAEEVDDLPLPGREPYPIQYPGPVHLGDVPDDLREE